MPFEANVSRARNAGFLALSVLATAQGLAMVGAFGPAPDTAIKIQVVGWLCVIFFGLGIPLAARRMFESGVEMRIDTDGVYWRRWSEQVIPWSAIKEISTRAVRRQRFACLFLHDPAAYPSSTVLGRAKRLNAVLGYGDIALTVADTDRSFDEMMAAIDRFAPAHLH